MADKTKTIKNATDQELDDLIKRLRKESEAQSIIADIKRKSASGYLPYDHGQEVSTEQPIESLYHFGIPGMKWGRRKGQATSRVSTIKKPKVELSKDYKEAKAAKSKNYKSLSNAELQSLTKRMQLEKQLRELKSSDYTKGLDVVKTITAAGTTLAAFYALSTTPLGQAVKKAITKS